MSDSNLVALLTLHPPCETQSQYMLTTAKSHFTAKAFLRRKLSCNTSSFLNCASENTECSAGVPPLSPLRRRHSLFSFNILTLRHIKLIYRLYPEIDRNGNDNYIHREISGEDNPICFCMRND